jgi:tRNA G18 (ribose-2'-O)-methylase SpoU
VKSERKVYVVLDNIRSVFNTASIFRTSDCAGVSKIYLCGTTPTPIDRFGRKRQDFSKVALGAEDSVSWEYANDTLTLIRRLKKEGILVVAIEQAEKSTDFRKIPVNGSVAIILGAEVVGVSEAVLAEANIIAEIPMLGEKESLNVSVTAGVILFNSTLFN